MDGIEAPTAKPVEAPVIKGKAAENFRRLEQARDQAQKERDEAKARLAELEASSKETETLRKRAAELEDQLSLSNIERTPKFREKFVAGRESLVASGRTLAAELDVKPEVFDQALALKGKERRTFIDQNFDSQSAISEVTQAIRQIESLDAERGRELSNHKEVAGKYEADQREAWQRTSEEERQARVQSFKELLPAVQKKTGAIFTKTDDEAHNAIVEANLKLAEAIAEGTAADQDKAAAPYLAVTAKYYQKENAKLADENAKLKARLAEYTGAEPQLNGRGAEGDGGVRGKPQGMRDMIAKGGINAIRRQ
jgi:hypothetical protein